MELQHAVELGHHKQNNCLEDDCREENIEINFIVQSSIELLSAAEYFLS